MIGSKLEEIIKSKYGPMTCGACKRRVRRLNTMTPSEVMADIDNIAEQIYGSRKQIKSQLMKMMAEAMPQPMVIGIIKTHIKQAVEEHLNG
jgi:hypothetical protein